MNRYNKYNIKDTDRFDPYDFPKVQLELDDLVKATSGISVSNKGEIIVSYLKDHSIGKESLSSNPELSKVLTGGQLITSHVESLFESSRRNKVFLEGYEDFIRKTLA